jgi:hypothetical protein
VANLVLAQGYSRVIRILRVGLRAGAAAVLVLLFFLGGTLDTALLLGSAAGVCVLPVLADVFLRRMRPSEDSQSTDPAQEAIDERDIIPEGAIPQAPYIEYLDPPDDRERDA